MSLPIDAPLVSRRASRHRRGRKRPQPLMAVGWLMLLHGLADLALGACRLHEVAPEATHLLSTTLPCSQACLLTIWLVLGSERLMWRVSGFLGGLSLVFAVLSMTAFPTVRDRGPGAHWLNEEWTHYFQPSQPGDWLIKLPVLFVGLAVPLIAWRIVRARRKKKETRDGVPPGAKVQQSLQFSVREFLVGMIAVSLAMVAVFRTAPYFGWLGQLGQEWLHGWRIVDPASAYRALSAFFYVLAALASLFIVFGKRPLSWRLPLVIGLTLLVAVIFDYGTGRFAETPSVTIALTTMAASLGLYKVYGQMGHRS